MIKKYSEIDEVNANSKLKYKLGEPNINILKENNEIFETLRNYMSLDFCLPNIKEKTLKISFYSFPTDEDGYCLASYTTKSTDDNIFGIAVGTNIREAEDIIEKFGYKKIKDFEFKKGVVNISFECNEIFNLSKEKDSEYTQLRIKERIGLLTDEDKVLLGKYEDYKNTICGFKVSLESKYLGNRIY